MKHIWFFQHQILSWFQKNGRLLPWRVRFIQELRTEQVRDRAIYDYIDGEKYRDPYIVLVSELMLQQTQVERVIPKFLDFMQKWPTINDLSKATLTEIIVAWKGLGYNSRAKHLLETARVVSYQYDGHIPSSEDELVKLPGIGPYTARAVLAFAYNRPVAVIDTNIRRIFSRYMYGGEYASVSTGIHEFEQIVLSTVPHGLSDPWYQALMDFGAMVCMSLPKCDKCPIRAQCSAFTQAQKHNQLTYKAVLQMMKDNKTKTEKPFRQTDRYLRGRIIDELRAHEVTMKNLKRLAHDTWGLKSTQKELVRWGRIIEKLKTDELISITGTTVSLKK